MKRTKFEEVDALAIINTEGDELSISAASVITDEAAAVLSTAWDKKLQASINVRKLTPFAAKALAGCKGSLWLRGFKIISDECANELSGFSGERMDTEIDPKNLSKEAARSLCQISGLLRFEHGWKITDRAEFDFDSEKNLAPEHIDLNFAKKWVKGPKAYSLAKASSISEDAALYLSKHSGKSRRGFADVL